MTVTETPAAARVTCPDVRPSQLFIGGQWREAGDGARIDVDDAVTAARAAFPGWRDTPPRERARILQRVSQLIRERADEIVAVESLDVGKPVSLCRPVASAAVGGGVPGDAETLPS